MLKPLAVSQKVSAFALAFRNERHEVQHEIIRDGVILEKHIATIMRAFSSAGSERLPYKQRVGGSNPSTPT